MPPRTLVLMFGGRPQPNAILAAMLRPMRVMAVVSQDSRYEVQKVLAGVVSGKVTVEKVPAYQMRRVQEVLEKHLDDRVEAIGVTGAPLPMAIVAYEVGRQRDLPVYYVNTSQGEILDLVHLDRQPLHINVSLRDFLRVHGLTLDPLPPPSFATTWAQRLEAARLLGQTVTLSSPLLTWLREERLPDRDTLERRKRWPSRFTQAHWERLQNLQDLQMLRVTLPYGRPFPFPRSWVTVRFPAKGERQFLFGEWLEVYVAEEARATGLLDDVKQGIRFRVEDGYRELDFLALYRGIPLLGSCKATRKPWRKGYLDELNAVADLMGGRYTWRFFFTDQTSPSPNDVNAYRSYQEFMAHAQRLRVRVITAHELPRWRRVLQQELQTPTYPLI